MKRIVIVLLTLFCTSCSTPLANNLESRQAYVDSNRLDDSVQEAILAERVISGMTKDNVYATWGWPSETGTSETLGLNGQYGKEVWIYKPFLDMTPEAKAFFRNGVVYSVSPEYLSEIPED